MTTPAHVLAAVRSIPHPRQETAVTAPEPTADVRGLLDRLDQAHAAGTPGPWQYDPSEGDAVWDADEQRPSVIALTRDPYGNCEADAALIVAAVNALPQLTAAVRGVAALAAELEAEAELVCASSPHACEAYGAAADRIRAAITAALTG